jgi:hypothetical protein
VSLWINNDEGLYGRAVELVRAYGARRAAYRLSQELPATTPDGARYNVTCIREALTGILS